MNLLEYRFMMFYPACSIALTFFIKPAVFVSQWRLTTGMFVLSLATAWMLILVTGSRIAKEAK